LIKATSTEQEREIAAQEGLADEEEEEEAKLPLGGALALLCLVTVAITLSTLNSKHSKNIWALAGCLQANYPPLAQTLIMA